MTEKRFTAPDLIAVGHAVLKLTGKPPSRDDFTLERRPEIERLIGAEAPSTYHFRDIFGTWSEYLKIAGLEGEGGDDLSAIERAAIRHCVDILGVTEETAERSVIDGWLPDSRPVEIKGSVLRQHHSTKQHFFGFRIHGRTVSASCDELILVGLSRELKPIARLHIPKEALPSIADGKSNITIYAPAIWGQGTSKYRRFVRWVEPHSIQGAVQDWSAGLPSKK